MWKNSRDNEQLTVFKKMYWLHRERQLDKHIVTQMLLDRTWNDVIIQNTKTSAVPHSGAWLRHVVLA